jgi:hypothetical protein
MISIFFMKFIQDVFYIDNCLIIFLSISKLSKELNYEVICKKKSVIFQDQLNKEKISEVYLENEFYFLNMNKFIFNT